jgi:hypothetical protein
MGEEILVCTSLLLSASASARILWIFIIFLVLISL